MKLLAWMHRKFQQGNGKAVEDVTITGSSRNEKKKYCLKQSYVRGLFGERRNNFHKKTFTNSWEEEEGEEEPRDSGEAFRRFLAIATLGSDGVTMPPTSTFTVATEKIAENETPAATESEQKLVCHGTEKVIEAEIAEHEQRNSPAMKEARKSSLGELFQKTPLEEKNCSKKKRRGDPSGKEEGHSHGHNAMKERQKNKKKMMMINSSSCAGDDDATTGKLNKMLQLFRKKVHPEKVECACTTGKQSQRKNTKAHREGQMVSHGAGNAAAGKTSTRKKTKLHGTRSKPPNTQLHSSDSNTTKEYWIKTDSEYVVLEL